MLNARAKGAAGEREVIHLVQEIIDNVAEDVCQEYGVRFEFPRLVRNTLQSAQGGEDIAGLPWYSFEVKRCEKLDVGRWWLQAVRQSNTHTAKVLQSTLTMQLENATRCLPDREIALGGGVAGKPSLPSVRMSGGLPNAQKVPVLVYRQSGQAWRVVIWGNLSTLDGKYIRCPVDIAWVAFALWLKIDLRVRLRAEFDRLFPQRAPSSPFQG